MHASTESTGHGGHARQYAASAFACFCFMTVVLTIVRSNTDVWTWSPAPAASTATGTHGYLASLGKPTYGPLLEAPEDGAVEPSAFTQVPDDVD